MDLAPIPPPLNTQSTYLLSIGPHRRDYCCERGSFYLSAPSQFRSRFRRIPQLGRILPWFLLCLWTMDEGGEQGIPRNHGSRRGFISPRVSKTFLTWTTKKGEHILLANAERCCSLFGIRHRTRNGTKLQSRYQVGAGMGGRRASPTIRIYLIRGFA